MQNLHYSRVRLKRRTIFITVLVCIAVGIALLVFRSRANEPRYNGKPLSYWLALYEEDAMAQTSSDFEKAENAVRAIGTNALPYLLEWISYEPPQWRKNLPKHLPARLADNDTVRVLIDGPSDERASLAGSGFEILGTNAAPAIPQLGAMMKDQQTPNRAHRAMFALGCIGSPAIPALTNALADPQQKDRLHLIWALRLNAFRTGTNAILPALLTALSDKDPQVRSSASKVVALIAPETLTNAPPQ